MPGGHASARPAWREKDNGNRHKVPPGVLLESPYPADDSCLVANAPPTGCRPAAEFLVALNRSKATPSRAPSPREKLLKMDARFTDRVTRALERGKESRGAANATMTKK